MRESIFAEINSEREYQDKKWGTAFDDKNTANDWVAYIAIYLGKAVTMPFNRDAYRTALVKIATLAVAGIEALGRNGENFAKRHYD